MSEMSYFVYNQGDANQGLTGTARKVLTAMNEIDGTTLAKLIALDTGLPVFLVRVIIDQLIEEGCFEYQAVSFKLKSPVGEAGK